MIKFCIISAASKVKYSFDNEEEVESEDNGDDGDFKAFDAETGQYLANGDDDIDFNVSADIIPYIDDEEPPPNPKPKTPPKKAAEPKKAPAAK